MYALTSNIKIGDARITAISDVRITRSVYQLGATAVIKLPVTAVLNRADEPPTKIETATQINIGDKVTIKLGYDGVNKTEFVGYVKSKNLRTPIEIECEDAFYLTRKKNVKNSGTITLKTLLENAGLKIGFCEPLTLKNYAVPNLPLSTVLARIKQTYRLAIFFDLEGKIYACKPDNVVGDTVKYVFTKNVISDDNLQYVTKDDVILEVKAICYTKNGSKLEVKQGKEGGEMKTLHFYDVESETELNELAKRELAKRNYDGYDGSITTFLQPYAAPTMVAEITDNQYTERSGRYYIEEVSTSFGKGGGRRRIQIGQKM